MDKKRWTEKQIADAIAWLDSVPDEQVAKRWRRLRKNRAVNFLNDVGPRPSGGHVLARRFDSRVYCKTNARWEERPEVLHQYRVGRKTLRVVGEATRPKTLPLVSDRPQTAIRLQRGAG